MAVVADDDMVEKAYRARVAGFFQRLRLADVGGAGARVPGRVVMDQDERSRPFGKCNAYYLAYVDYRRGVASDGETTPGDDIACLVE